MFLFNHLPSGLTVPEISMTPTGQESQQAIPFFSCVRRLRRVLAEHGIPYDRKRFAPHITLVRKAEFTGRMDALLQHLPTVGMDVHEISLMRSDRGKNGMIYARIGSIEAET